MRPPRHLLDRELGVWRRVFTADGAGGRSAIWQQVGTVAARVSQPTAAERTLAAQAGASLTDAVYLVPDAAVARNDELRGDGQVYRVHATVTPSANTAYLRCDCERVQPEQEV